MKKTSLIREPHRQLGLLKAGVYGVKVLFLDLVDLITRTKNEIESPSEQTKTQNDAFQKASIYLNSPEGQVGWRNYVLVYTAIQVVLFAFLLYSMIETSLFMFFYAFALVVSALILGYRPWMVREKKLVSFGHYLIKAYRQPQSFISILNFKLD